MQRCERFISLQWKQSSTGNKRPSPYLINPAITSASLLILVDSLNRCFPPGLKALSGFALDFSLKDAFEKTLSLSSFAVDDVEDPVMVDAVSEDDFDGCRSSFMTASRLAYWR